MLTQVCQYLRNWFVKELHRGTYTINGGSLTVDFLQNGQYYRVVGSVFNDGVHMYPTYDMINETFTGEIWAMAVPKAVIELSEDIQSWCNTNHDALNTPYASESFGGYSYTFSGYGSGGSSAKPGWQSQFAERLAVWRKI